MYAYIKGILSGNSDTQIVVENSGIGYLINCPVAVSSELGRVGDEVTVYVYQSVKEDDISLYGFATREQKDMFLKLITVSGIGPKVAHSICGSLSPEQLAVAVMGSNVGLLTSVKGLGRKTAERIILELKDKVTAQVRASGSTVTAASSGAPAASSVAGDAVGALLVLGFREQVAEEAVAASYEEGIALEPLIKKALKFASGSRFA